MLQKPLQTSGWTHHKGRINHKILVSHVFVYGRSHPDGSEDIPAMSTINFNDLLGRTCLLPLDANGERKRATISDHINTISQDQVSRGDNSDSS